MKWFGKYCILSICFIALIALSFSNPNLALAAKPEAPVKGSMAEKVPKPNAAFDINKMADMSDFDPANPVIPTGDTIKIAVVWPHSGAAVINGQYAWLATTWVAHDINKRGGIWVDGKRKLIEPIKADNMSKPDQCKKICERMALQEKVQVLLGTSGSNMMKIINETANKYKILGVNIGSLADDLQDATNFSRHAFMSCDSTEQIGRGLAYYYGQIRKKEKKFYILCQDYNFGHGLGDGFKKGLKEYYPESEVVGEDYHKLFQTDYAPYMTKIKASGAEVIYTGDWMPDSGNLVKQARQMGINIPFANIFMDDANVLQEVGIAGSKGLVHIDKFGTPPPAFKSPAYVKFYTAWHNQWKNKWKTPPYNGLVFEHGTGPLGSWVMQIYWMLSVFERAKSTDPEKVIPIWENDSYQYPNGKIIKMRACDHKAIQDFQVSEYVEPQKQKVSYNIPPYYWFKGSYWDGPGWLIPAAKALPWMDQKLDRCKGKNDWGE
jgi:branched-chain amino acid transport system substrate-binding protein